LLVPTEVVTVTSTVPGVEDDGAIADIEVGEFTVTALPVRVVAPKDTVAAAAKLVPVIVTAPPPASGDESGVISMIVGALNVDAAYV
jgi:hypothetical protein